MNWTVISLAGLSNKTGRRIDKFPAAILKMADTRTNPRKIFDACPTTAKFANLRFATSMTYKARAFSINISLIWSPRRATDGKEAPNNGRKIQLLLSR